MHLYGFTFLRNVLKYDYPFRESLESLKFVTENLIVALGKSEDTTESEVGRISGLTIENTVWDPNLLTGGLILSQQTNVALNFLRRMYPQPDAWGLYLQADELVHERDREQLLADFHYADENGYDAISFRYIHFWQTYNQIAIRRWWYPQEIRGVKLLSKIESWGDAQSFRNCKKILLSDVPIYHYGHVRDQRANEMKKSYFLSLHHGDDQVALAKSKKKELRPEKWIRYFGPHPKVMQKRMGPCWQSYEMDSAQDAYVIGDPRIVSPDFTSRVVCQKIHWGASARELGHPDPARLVVLETRPLQRIYYQFRYPSVVRRQMDSPQARPWPNDFWATLKFSEKGFGVR